MACIHKKSSVFLNEPFVKHSKKHHIRFTNSMINLMVDSNFIQLFIKNYRKWKNIFKHGKIHKIFKQTGRSGD